MLISACRRAYDHRLRDLVCEQRDPTLLHELGVPRSTAASWIRRGQRPVISAEVLAMDQQELQTAVLALQRRARFLLAILRLAFLLVRLSGFRLDSRRVPDGNAKRTILSALFHARKALPLTVALRVLRLSPSRYHAWTKLAEDCPFDDRSSCPKTSPSQLTPKEIFDAREMVVAHDQRHMTIRSLALYAQRIGKVFASPTTWARLVRKHGWRRPRRRLHPPKPKYGIRATKPNEYWHMDVSIIKLLDGTRTYLHAVIDNFSRRILSWTLALRLEPQNACQVLVEATKNLPKVGSVVTVVTDSGIENVNHQVDALLSLGQLNRVLAQIEVSFSNSMIEAWWRSLKHGWLYLHPIDTFATLEKLIAFYVEQYNTIIPHSAFAGQTPDEMYFGCGEQVPADLATARARTTAARMMTNRESSCETCKATLTLPTNLPDSPAVSDLLHLQPEDSRMS